MIHITEILKIFELYIRSPVPWIATYMAGTSKVSNIIWVIFSLSRFLTEMLSGSDIVYAVGMAAKFSLTIHCKMSFDWALENLSHVWVRLFVDKLELIARRDRTRGYADSVGVNEDFDIMLNLKSVAFRIERRLCE